MQKRISYEIREIDEHGDVIDTTEYFDGRGSKAKADNAWTIYELWHDDAAAAIYERVEKWGDEDDGLKDVRHTTLGRIGSKQAMVAGGWND